MSVTGLRSTVVVVLVLAVVATAATTGGAVADQGSDAAVGFESAATDEPGLSKAASVVDVDADRIVTWIDLRAGGDATWTIEYWILLDSEEEEAAFRSLEEDIESDPANYTEQFGDRMTSTAENAGEAVDREMGVHDVTVDTEVQDLGTSRYGVVTYRFEWTSFAVEEGDTLQAGDAIEGMFLEEGNELVIRWPDEYELDEVRPSADGDLSDENRVGWAGRTDFGPGEPHLVVSAAGPDGVAVAQPVGLLALVIVLGLTAAAGIAWHRRRDARKTDSATDDGTLGESTADPAGDGVGVDPDTGAGDGAESSPVDDPGDGTGTVTDPNRRTVTDPNRRTPDPDAEPPEELLSNEERVMKFVSERGGRIKQQEIVKAFGWTDAKTSQVVRKLRDEGELDGFRLGRENVLYLPGEETDPANDEDGTDPSDERGDEGTGGDDD